MRGSDLSKIEPELLSSLGREKPAGPSDPRRILIRCRSHRPARAIGRHFAVRVRGHVTPFLAFEAGQREILNLAADPSVVAISADPKFPGWKDVFLAPRPAQSCVVARYRNGIPEWLDGDGVRVVIADTGLSPHPDIKKPVRIEDVTGEDEKRDLHTHGNPIAGIFLAEGAFPGLAPGAEIIMVRIFDREARTTRSRVAKALDVAVSEGARIFSASFGGPLADPVMRTVYADVHRRGILVVAAAGNEGPADGTVAYPAAFPEVIAVGACTVDGRLAPFSSRGTPGQTPEKPDLCAEGVRLVCLDSPDGHAGTPVRDGYVQVSGTSFAAPITAALAALLLERHPRTSPEQIRALLRRASKPIVV